MAGTIRCILFDMDNTLLRLDVDWEGLTRDINLKYFNGKYLHMTPHQFFVAYFNLLMGRLPEWQHREIMKYRLDAELAGIPQTVCFPYRGVLKKLHRKHKLGVVSGNLRKTIVTALKKCGLSGYVDAIVAIDEVAASKPSPVPLRAALRALGCDPAHAVYVGDHPDDMRAGKAASMRTIAVRHSRHYAEMKKAGIRPDATIRSLFELETAIKRLDALETKEHGKEHRLKVRAKRRERKAARKEIEKVAKAAEKKAEWKRVVPALQLHFYNIIDKLASVIRWKR